ncbi:flagellin [Pantoea sp. DY-17]|uniref:flagellin N-terminal helical domain-containing protein n=2 Tax=unclassified Pantoea TaxID=2630326 RepID=UPI0010C9BBAE|nr:flagellin [Pantoea sp. DY-17]MBY4953622.1 lateral flagellin LafA [Pantoea sp. DY-17]QCP60837.1 lateral flagellin LafA [Pantoea sp. SO10]
MLTMFTNSAAMSSTNSMNRANSALSTAMERLGTGYRINSAADDAAGLQIATRLDGQARGMGVAQNNISKATAMMQTAEGAFDEVNNILFRMKDLATQAADDTNNADDRGALQSEFDALNAELGNIMSNTSYGTEKLFARDASGNGVGKMTGELQFQIGASKDETLKINLSGALGKVSNALTKLSASGISGGAAAGNAMLENVTAALDSVGSIRSDLGANINRLGHTAANLANMKDNTELNLGIIQDADFAAEGAKMSRQQMLMQSSQQMLSQSKGMGQMVLGMLG